MQGAWTAFCTVLSLAAILLAGTGTRACAAAGVDDKSFFPLMAWDYVEDEDTIRKMAECEVNMIAFVPVKLLDACQKHGVKAIVYHPSITPARWDQPFDSVRANKTLPALIKQVNSHPAVYGYHLKDEPGGDQFAELDRPVALGAEIVTPGQRAQGIAVQNVLDREADGAMHLMGDGGALFGGFGTADLGRCGFQKERVVERGAVGDGVRR